MRSKYGKRGVPRALRPKKDQTLPTMPLGTPAKPDRKPANPK
jgi:hypothetical protein